VDLFTLIGKEHGFGRPLGEDTPTYPFTEGAIRLIDHIHDVIKSHEMSEKVPESVKSKSLSSGLACQILLIYNRAKLTPPVLTNFQSLWASS
jgi:hypothetical protein